jgi:hypothetical protein
MPVWVKAALIAALAWPYWLWLIRLCASVHYNDFGKFYFGLREWQQGRSLYSLTPASFLGDLPDPLTNLNPPHAMLAVWPLSSLPPEAAFAVWMILNAAAIAYSAARVGHETGWTPGVWELTVLLIGAPTATWLVTGQLTGLLLLPLVLSWQAWRHGDLRRAGVWLGIAISVKPFLGTFVVWMIWRREWRGVAAAAAAISVMFVMGLSVFGVQAHLDWLASVRAVSWSWAAMNSSVLAIVTRAVTTTPYHIPFAHLPALVNPLWLCAVAGVGVLLVRSLESASVDDGWGVLMSGTLLISPLGWAYYHWWLLPGLPRLASSALSVLLLLPLPVTALTGVPQPGPWTSLTIGSAYSWALLWAFVTAATSIRSSTRRSSVT